MSVWRSETINIGISKCVTKGTRQFNSCSGNYHKMNIPVYIKHAPAILMHINSSAYPVTKSYMYVRMVMHS